VGRLGKGWRDCGEVSKVKTCCEVRKGVECLVGGHVMDGGSVGRSEKGWRDCVEGGMGWRACGEVRKGVKGL